PDGILVLPKDSTFVVSEIYLAKIYNRFHEIRNGDIVIDVGAHVGTFTLRATRRVGNGLVIAVEPNPLNYKLLMENIRRNKLENTVALNLALSSYNGVARLYMCGVMSSIMHHVSNEYIEVPVKKLDDVVNELKIEKVDMIKMDAEGAELEILKGAENTLKRNNIHLAIAAYHAPTEVQEVSKFLLDKEFEFIVSKDKFVYAWR
ncbi:MAG: FkbM family methyltransferase, partial [archaeon]|nr:FkbM family methyltransferase [archaeon]